jgi:DNA-binding transcriptional regulator YiaG
VTPAELRTARKVLGLTQHGLAEVLRMGKWGFQSVAKWEKGEIPVPGPVAVAVELMLEQREFVAVPRAD